MFQGLLLEVCPRLLWLLEASTRTAVSLQGLNEFDRFKVVNKRMSILPSSTARSPRSELPAVPRGSQLQCWQTGASSSKRQSNLRRDLCRPELMSEVRLQQIPAGKMM